MDGNLKLSPRLRLAFLAIVIGLLIVVALVVTFVKRDPTYVCTFC
jgi:hypothetical protein